MLLKYPNPFLTENDTAYTETACYTVLVSTDTMKSLQTCIVKLYTYFDIKIILCIINLYVYMDYFYTHMCTCICIQRHA